MNCWAILGIEQTDDPAAIKRAYAAQVKKTKPDEDPEGFGRLHGAYKQALAAAKDNAAAKPREEPEPLQTEDCEVEADTGASKHRSGAEEREPHTSPAPERELISGQVLVAGEQDDEDLHTAWDRLSASVVELLADPHRANRVENWQFLDSENALYEFGFRAEFSWFLFGRIMDEYALKPPVIRHLDQRFRWSEQRDALELEYGYEEVELLLGPDRPENVIRWTCPKQHHGPLVHGNYYARIFATILDVVLLTFMYEGLLRLAFEPLGPSGIFGGVGLYLILAPILEATPMQGTPAKVLFGLKVASAEGRRLNIIHAVGRTLLFAISTALFKITMFINLFAKDGRLLHDRLSRSLVVKRSD